MFWQKELRSFGVTPSGFVQDTWKPLSQVLKPDCVLESPGKHKKSPLLSPDGVARQTGKAISFVAGEAHSAQPRA